MIVRFAVVVGAIAASLVLTACGVAKESPQAYEEVDKVEEEVMELAATVEVEAGDMYLAGIPETLPAGTIQINLVNVGTQRHDVTVAEIGGVVVTAAEGGESGSGTVILAPGEYTFYCSVAGHRAAGMEHTVTVE